jgi:DNA-directed RNA polymerase specialized sigma24 family protein
MSDPEDEEAPRDADPRALIQILLQKTSIHRHYCEKRIGADAFDDVVASIVRTAAADPVKYADIAANPARLMATIKKGTAWISMREQRFDARQARRVRGFDMEQEDVTNMSMNPEHDMDFHALLDHVARVVAGMPAEYRDVYISMVHSELSYREAAVLHGVSPRVIADRLQLARACLAVATLDYQAGRPLRPWKQLARDAKAHNPRRDVR